MSKPSDENMKQALKAVGEGMSVRQASMKFGVPKSTLHFRKNRGKVNEVKLEKSGKLSDDDEQRLANWVLYCQHMGYFQLNHTRLSEEAENLSKSQGSMQKFNKEWCKYFTQRHSKVKLALDLYKNSKYFDKLALEVWFRAFQDYCKDHSTQQALQNPQLLFFCCRLHISENLKMMVSFSASGMATPPLIINANLKDAKDVMDDFDGVTLPRGWVKYNCVQKPYHQDQENIYHYYLEHVLKSYLRQKSINFPIILFQKYQNSPPKLPTYELCCHLEIFPVNSYPTAFKINQSLQNDVWARSKNMQHKYVSSYMDVVKHVLLFKLTKSKMSSSFWESGLYPLDISKVNPEQIIRLQIKSMENDGMENETDAFCDIEHVDSAQITDEMQSLKPSICLKLEEFREFAGSEIITKLEDTTKKKPSSKEFKALTKIYDKFKFDEDDDIEVRNEPLLPDDPLSDNNVPIVVEPELVWN